MCTDIVNYDLRNKCEQPKIIGGRPDFDSLFMVMIMFLQYL